MNTKKINFNNLSYVIELERRSYFHKVKDGIKQMYRIQEEKVTIVGHSYRGVVVQCFLAKVVKQGWKNKYIKAFIPHSAPFGVATNFIWALKEGILPFVLWGDAVFNGIKRMGEDVIRTFKSQTLYYYL